MPEIVVGDVILENVSYDHGVERTESLRVSPDAKINLLNHLLKVEVRKRALDTEKKI